jgi:transposase, IS5 family
MNLKLVYAKNFAEDIGAPALPFRIALGSLIIKERLGISARETVEQIKENPYLQYFIGQTYYSNEGPYDASLLVKFRERINVNIVNQINQRMVKKIQEETEEESKKKAQPQKDKKQEKSTNKGN